MKKILKDKFNICLVLVTIFVGLKLLRNTTTDTDTQGGIWCVIPFMFLLYATVLFVYNIYKKRKMPVYIILPIAYTIVSMANALFVIKQLDIRFIYSFFMIGCFASVLVVFYYLSLQKLSEINIRFVLVCCVLIIIFALVSLFKIRTESLTKLIANLYFSLTIFPLFLFFSKNKIFNIVVIALTGISVLFSAKRVGLIAYALFLLCYNFVVSFQNKSFIQFRKAFLIFGIICIAFLVVYNSVADIYNIDILYRMANLSSDGGSGRDKLYTSVWNAYKISNFEDKMMGHGLFSVKRYGHGHAHDDFLDVLFHFGFIPCGIIILFYLSLFYESLLMVRYRYNKVNIFLGGLCISFFLSLFSVYITGGDFIVCGMTFMGIALGQWERVKNKLIGEY